MTTILPPAPPKATDSQPPKRPSLLAGDGGQVAAGENEPIRILTYLEATNDEGMTRPEPTSRKTTILAMTGAVLAVVTVAFAVLPPGVDGFSLLAEHGEATSPATATTAPPMRTATISPSPGASPQAERQADTAPAGLAALIENIPPTDKPSAASDAPVRPVAELTTAPLAHMKQDGRANSATPPGATRAPTVVDRAQRNTAPASPLRAPARTAHLASSSNPIALPTGRGTTPPPAATDRDVALIAALVAHSEGRSANDVRPAKSAMAVPARTAEPKRRESATRTIDLRRDVVLHQEGASTEELIQRCRSLGMLEGELCRWRICSGLWDKDPACKQIGPRPSSDVYSVSN